MTESVKKRQNDFLTALRASGGIISTACKKSNVGRSQFYTWIRENEQFAQEYEAVKNEMLDFAESCLLQAMREGNLSAIIFFLKCQGKGRGWQESTPQNAITNNVQAVNINVSFDE